MLFSRADIKGRPHVDNSVRSSVPRYVQHNRSQLTPLTTPSRLWTAPRHWQRRLPPTTSISPAPSPRRFHRKCATAFAQRKLGNGVCGSLRVLSENSTSLAGKRRPPEGNACWTMKSSNCASLYACATAGALAQPRKGREAKHSGCCSLLAGKRIGAFPWHRFAGTVGERVTSSCVPGIPAAPLPGNAGAVGRHGGS